MHVDHPNRRGDRRHDRPLTPRSAVVRRPRAFTLVEAVLSLAIIALLLLAMQSAILLAARAAPDARTAPALKAEGGRALQTLANDVTYASAVVKATATELILTLPDRDGDGSPETIRYAWAGTADARLTRQFNSTAAQTIATNVQSLRFTYDTQTQTTAATTATDGPEILLASYDTTATPKNSTVDANHWIGACFRPSIPATATSWSITRVRFKARQKGSALGQAFVQVRPAIGNVPGSTVLAQATISEAALPLAYDWQDLSVAGASGLPPGTAAALVIQWGSDADACEIAYVDNDAVANANLTTTTNAGSSWAAGNGELLFSAFGRVRTPDAAVTQTTLRSVRCSMTFPGDVAVDATVRAINSPVVAP